MKLKCGTIREDGMVFFRYSPSCKDGENWVTLEKYEERKRKDKEYKNKKYKNDIAFKNKRKLLSSIRRKNDDVVKNQKEYIKIWRKNNHEKFRIYHTKYSNKNKKNPIYKLRKSIPTLIRNSFAALGSKKNSRTTQILGCTIPDFKSHIESQFLPGMNWENRHLWHIDHIMPVSMANTYDEVVRLNHYKNLRPMWASDNLRKSDKIGDTLVLF